MEEKDGFETEPKYIISAVGPDSDFKVGQQVIINEAPIKQNGCIVIDDECVVACT